MSAYTSRIGGFYRCSVPERRALLARHAAVSPETLAVLAQAGGALDVAVADRMVENVIGVHGLPLGVALNFLVNGVDYVVPMAVEEPSVVAAASNAARMIRASGGFEAEATPAVMTAQVQFDGVPDVGAAARAVHEHRRSLLALGDASIPRMVERGGGCRDLELRVLDAAEGVVVVHVYVDVGDAMGANMVDTVAEALADPLHALMGGTVGLRILSNLCARRMVTVRARVSSEMLGGDAVSDGVARASRFASLDPFRAATHNKGFMNGVDAAAVALGQDWRGIEAGAHAFAAMTGAYRPLSTWARTAEGLEGRVEMPLAVGTVGGSTQCHAGVRAAFEVLRVPDARTLAMVLASVGLASNLAALRALAAEGIQRGHMKLHQRKAEAEALLHNGAHTP